jgi:hypothetical protein
VIERVHAMLVTAFECWFASDLQRTPFRLT